ncbi:MAG: hypothetical protein JSR42_19915 [Proteobacteria bacterium]|nr:hypothetical protein [Pseudomonadota bacterium]
MIKLRQLAGSTQRASRQLTDLVAKGCLEKPPGSGIGVGEKVGHALKVVDRARRIDQARQGFACSFSASRSAIRAFSQACTSAAS